MSTKSFKDLVVWQKASELTVDIYGTFGNIRDFGFRDQIQRASISIMNNIAEGYARRSDKAFRQFLLIAKGSTAEVESMLIIAERLSYVHADKQVVLIAKTEEVGRLLSGFVAKLSAKDY
ncbi:MAG TPA: four helix bundle protein [Nevskiaceae bacterium]|nr:four helix bundle protein [Nevskiaceae bacterium]